MDKILLIDDDLALINTYEKILVDSGYKVVKALNGQEGLLKVRNEQFDLIITDLDMPKVSGQKFIEVLQGDTSAPLTCPIIISSGFIDNSVINSFMGHGRIHFLPKPSLQKEFLEKVRSLLTKAPQKPKIDVRFVNPILEATVHVISTMTSYAVTFGKPFVKPPGDTSGDISGVVGVVSSAFKGTISLSFTESAFLKVISKMLSTEYKEIDEDNKDAVAEMLNIIFGRAKTALNKAGMNIQPAIPSIIRGKNHSIEHHSKSPTIVIPFNAPEIGNFRSEVSSIG